MSSIALKTVKIVKNDNHSIIICQKNTVWSKLGIHKNEADFIVSEIKRGKRMVEINQYKRFLWIQLVDKHEQQYKELEACRKDGSLLLERLSYFNIKRVTIIDANNKKENLLAFIEGMVLNTYKFVKYLGTKNDKSTSLQSIEISSQEIGNKDLKELQEVSRAVFIARNLVNEPLSYLTATRLSSIIRELGKNAGFKTEILEKNRIEALKMGGLLAVNQASVEPPTFNIMEWKPRNAVNKKPFILVGKGIVFDTGGLSLKPTKNSMDSMKSDMAGAAAVVGSIYAISKNKLPVYVIGLVPATENRPGGNAYTPGDIIRMMNGSTVEVLNTDAEGRLILADALSYAIRYKPKFVFDLATLTGAAVRAIGTKAIAYMGSGNEEMKKAITNSGNHVYERLVELPFWDEYGNDIKSQIADLKNIGGINGGAITAGKFLEHFTKVNDKHAYPWFHLDIAGIAFLDKQDSYRPAGGTGVGVRLLYDFFKSQLNG